MLAWMQYAWEQQRFKNKVSMTADIKWMYRKTTKIAAPIKKKEGLGLVARDKNESIIVLY